MYQQDWHRTLLEWESARGQTNGVLANAIIEAKGGQISVESKVGQG